VFVIAAKPASRGTYGRRSLCSVRSCSPVVGAVAVPVAVPTRDDSLRLNVSFRKLGDATWVENSRRGYSVVAEQRLQLCLNDSCRFQVLNKHPTHAPEQWAGSYQYDTDAIRLSLSA
jgi:hypothetical protein